MRVALFVNPGSGGSTDPTAVADALRRAGAEVDEHPLAELDTADLAGAQRVVIASGDGAVGDAAARAAEAGMSLAVVPSGTANDFARALGVPRDVDEATRLAADPDAPAMWLDVGCAGSHPFVNVAACGMSVVATGRAKSFKRLLGPLAYPAGALSAGLTSPRLATVVRVDGEEVFHGDAWQVLVAGTGAFGGGSVVGPVELDDRKLDVAVMTARGRHRLAVHALRMRFGGLTEEDDVHHHRGRHVEVDVRGPWNVDGERIEDPGAGRLHVRSLCEVVVGPDGPTTGDDAASRRA